MINLSYPLNMQVELTELCNHKCFYCYNSWQLNKDKNAYMHEKEADTLSKIIIEDIKSFQVTLTGGEPIMNMPALLKFAKNLNDAGIYFNINTNLTLLN
jgi:organic radical activating enzyme